MGVPRKDLAALVKDDEWYPRKKQRTYERSPEEIAILAENIMAELEVAAEEDAELNRMSKPAITKLKKLPFLRDVVSKKYLQEELLDHGVLCALKSWLEPLPDGSLPNTTIRAAILEILTDYPMDLDREDRREQLKRSGLGKVIMFLSKSEEEIKPNQKLARSLVESWSRSIFFDHMTSSFNNNNDAARRRPEKNKVPPPPPRYQEDYHLDLSAAINVEEESSGSRKQQSRRRSFVTRPEPTAMQFVIRPPSKILPDQVQALVPNKQRLEMHKKLQRLRSGSKRKCLQAAKLSVHGRNVPLLSS